MLSNNLLEIVTSTSISLLLGSSLNSNVVVTAAVAVGSEKEGRSTAVMLLTTAGSRTKSWPDTMRDIISKENKMTGAGCK